MIACASLALDVPRRNLRNFSLVSGENEYSRESDYHNSAVSTWWGKLASMAYVNQPGAGRPLTILDVNCGTRREVK